MMMTGNDDYDGDNVIATATTSPINDLITTLIDRDCPNVVFMNS